MTERPKTPLLDTVITPADMKEFTDQELKRLADELRAETVSAVSETGGHLGAGLGVVELTVALHAVFNTPKRNIGIAPDKIEYNPFDLTFLVDEKMQNYKEIHDWILGLVTEDDFAVRKARDVTLQVLNSHNNVSQEIQFIDAFPINLSSLPFDATTTDIQYLTASVTFQYSYFKFKT